MAQEEGDVVTRQRIVHDKCLFVGGGFSRVLGNNFGDYSTGMNVEGGFIKRLNRVLSLGGSMMYSHFKYDPSILQKPPAPYEDPVNFFYGYDNSSNEIGSLVFLAGGNLSLISLSGNIKINFIPVKDNSVVSVYAFAKPFAIYSSVSSVTGRTLDYIRDLTTGDWGSPVGQKNLSYGNDNGFSGGVLLGPGIEFFPGKKISYFAQASYGYTFPIAFVSTRSYSQGIENLSDPRFPKKELGFTSINFAAGVSYNFD